MIERFRDEDALFFAYRDTLKGRNFDVKDLDHFTLFTGIHNFARKKFIIDEFEKTLDLTGNVYEFGTWRGATLVLLASWYRLRRPQGNKVIYVFDSFEGLASGTKEDRSAQGKHEGEYKSDHDALKKIITGKKLDAYVKFVVGDAKTTCQKHFQNVALKKVSFALLDMDLYEPTKCAIDELLPNLVPGGKILFDEGTCETWEGEQQALGYLVDAADKRGMRYSVEENPITRQPTTVFTRLA